MPLDKAPHVNKTMPTNRKTRKASQLNSIEPPMPRKDRATEDEVKADAESAFGSPPVDHKAISWQAYESRRISELEARLAQQRAARLAKAAQEAAD
jgi:hypothetical protein